MHLMEACDLNMIKFDGIGLIVCVVCSLESLSRSKRFNDGSASIAGGGGSASMGSRSDYMALMHSLQSRGVFAAMGEILNRYLLPSTSFPFEPHSS